MGDMKKLSLLEETEREAREIEKELEEHPELDEIQVTDAMDAALFARIQAYEDSKGKLNIEDEVEFSDEIAPELPEDVKTTVPYRKKNKKRYVIIGVAAVLGLVLGTGLVGIGNKAYWKEVLERNYGEEELKVIKVEDMDDIEAGDEETGIAFREINKQLGITVVRLGYIPKKINFLSVEIAENMQSARIFYDYEGEIIRYTIYLNSMDSSRAENKEDKKINEYNVLAKENNLEITVEEYQVPNYEEYRRCANFEYKGIYYQLKGIMEKEEFDNIIKNLKFFR